MSAPLLAGVARAPVPVNALVEEPARVAPGRRGVLWPGSFLSLVLAGFGLVALPLCAGLVIASVQVDRLADQSRNAVYDSVQAIQGGRALVEQIGRMERSARQYLVQRNSARFDAYADAHREFVALVEQLLTVSPAGADRAALQALAAREAEVYQALARRIPGSAEARAAVSRFADLGEQASVILGRANARIARQVEALGTMAARAQRLLWVQAGALLPGALALGLLFFALIARPVRQVEAAIRRLGDGQLDAPVAVAGPRDLVQLGRRLDWLRRRLVELEAQKTQFLRHMSHELKTPLTAVREGADLLAREVLGGLNAAQREAAEILRQNALRLQRQIEDLLAFSRAQRSEDVRSWASVRLDEVVRAALSDHRLSLRRKSIELALALDPVAVAGDATQLATIVDNLLSNAVKFAPARGHVAVSLAARGGDAVLEVRDDGPGIDPAERERIFEPFFQGAAPVAGAVKGTGLGLAIARDCARAHGGEIVVLERGTGACLQVVLPGAAAGEAPS